MKKGKPDGNIQKVLDNLENHPSLLKRCQSFYLDRVINKLTYEELSKQHGVSISTAYAYVTSYRKVAERYADTAAVVDVLAFCHSEIARLLQRRKDVETSREYKDLTGEIRQYQDMVNEISGLINRKTEINIKILNNIIATITEAVPAVFETFMGQTITPELVSEAMQNLADSLEQATENT